MTIWVQDPITREWEEVSDYTKYSDTFYMVDGDLIPSNWVSLFPLGERDYSEAADKFRSGELKDIPIPKVYRVHSYQGRKHGKYNRSEDYYTIQPPAEIYNHDANPEMCPNALLTKREVREVSLFSLSDIETTEILRNYRNLLVGIDIFGWSEFEERLNTQEIFQNYDT